MWITDCVKDCLKHGFKFSITRPWKGEEKMKPVDHFNNPGTRDKPIDEIVDFSKTRRPK